MAEENKSCNIVAQLIFFVENSMSRNSKRAERRPMIWEYPQIDDLSKRSWLSAMRFVLDNRSAIILRPESCSQQPISFYLLT